MTLKIKDISLSSDLLLAPMAGFSDSPFRQMCKNFGAGLVTTEMVSVKALFYRSEKTEKLLTIAESEHPVAVQLFGHEPKIFEEVVKSKILDKFDIIDINMGCPAKKIVKNGDGSALMKNIELAREIIESCVRWTDKPVTVKMRLGESDDSGAVEFAKMCESAGASAVTVHGRTVKQGYEKGVNYDAIARIKSELKIPVIANGDCKSAEDYAEIKRITNADGVMVGRASLGQPEIFSEILSGKKCRADKLSQIEFHYRELMKIYPEKTVIPAMRGHLSFYLKSIRSNPALSKEKRELLNSNLKSLMISTNFAEIMAILHQII